MNDAETRALFADCTVRAYCDTKAWKDDTSVTAPDGTQMTHKPLIARFAAYPTPSWLFLSPEGAVLGAGRNGKTTARELRLELNRALAAYRKP